MSNNKKRNRPKPDPTVGTLPDLGDPADEPLATVNDDTPPDSALRTQNSGLSTQNSVPLEIPIGELSTTGYITGHVEVNHLSGQQKQGLNRLLNGLRGSRATLQDRNREVNTPADAVRWLLEKVAEDGNTTEKD